MNTVNTANAANAVNTVNTVADMPDSEICPCGGGQSCIVDRRWVGDWVHEDDVFKSARIPLRKNCFVNYTTKQKKALKTT